MRKAAFIFITFIILCPLVGLEIWLADYRPSDHGYIRESLTMEFKKLPGQVVLLDDFDVLPDTISTRLSGLPSDKKFPVLLISRGWASVQAFGVADGKKYLVRERVLTFKNFFFFLTKLGSVTLNIEKGEKSNFLTVHVWYEESEMIMFSIMLSSIVICAFILRSIYHRMFERKPVTNKKHQLTLVRPSEMI